MATWTNTTKDATTFSNGEMTSLATWGDAYSTWGDSVATWGSSSSNWTISSENTASYTNQTKN